MANIPSTHFPTLNPGSLNIPAPYDPNSKSAKDAQLYQLLASVAPAAGTALGGIAGAGLGALAGGLAGLPLGPGGAIVGGLGGALIGGGMGASAGSAIGAPIGQAIGQGFSTAANQAQAPDQANALKRQALLEAIMGMR